MVFVFGAERNIDLHHFPSPEELKDLEGVFDVPCKHGWFESCVGGAQLHYRKWLPTSQKPKGIIVHAHGIQTHSGSGNILKDGRRINQAYRAHEFVQAGFALYGHDYYGHGYSEGTRWLIPQTWRNNLKDYENFVRMVAREHPDVPLFLMGESYGSSLTLHLARHFQDHPDVAPANFDSIIVTASAIDGDIPPAPVVFVLRDILKPLFPRWTPFFMPNPISADRIWRDPEIRQIRLESLGVAIRLESGGSAFRLGTAANLLESVQQVKATAIPGLRVPYCALHGTADHGCPISGAEFLWEQTQESLSEDDREFHRLEGMYHDLFADPDMGKPMGIALAWLDKRIAKRNASDGK